MACTLCVLVVVLPLAVPVGALVVEAAVWLANRVLGRPAADRDYDYAVDDIYLPPWRPTAIPPPSHPKAGGLATLTTLGTLAAGFAIALAGEKAFGVRFDGMMVGVACGTAVAAYLIQTVLFALLLPTTFPRACLAAGFAMLVGLPVVTAAGGLALLGLNAIAPNMGR